MARKKNFIQHLWLRNWFIISVLIVQYVPVFAQKPTPQDCINAIPICKGIYDEPDPYAWSGNGAYDNEIYREVECIPEERNGIWYLFTANSKGVVRFSITPHDAKDDYDWAVFDLTNASCVDIATNENTNIMVSSNIYGSWTYNGSTGASSVVSGGKAGTCNGPGEENGPPWNDDIPVKQGNTYVLYVSNWSGSTKGYFIDFTESTAVIYDTIRPQFESIYQSKLINCGRENVRIRFSENVNCKSVASSSFALLSSSDTFKVVSVHSEVCDLGGEYDRNFIVQFDRNLPPGDFALQIVDTLIYDVCQNPVIMTQIPFKVNDIEIENFDFQNISCHGNNDGKINVKATSGDRYLLYSIDNGVTFEKNAGVFENLLAGTYNIIIGNEAGCRKSVAPITLTEPKPISIAEKHTNLRCYHVNDAQITVKSDGGTGKLLYFLHDGNKWLTQSNGIFMNYGAGNYIVRVEDINRCSSDSIQIYISQPDELIITSLVTSDIKCFGDNTGIIKADAAGGSGELLFTIDGKTFVQTAMFESLTKGEYTLSVTDTNGCKVSTPLLKIIEPPQLLIDTMIITPVTCFGWNNGNIRVDYSGGMGSKRLLWKGLKETNDNYQDSIKPGKYRIEIMDDNQCLVVDSFEITQPAKLESKIKMTPVTCNGGHDGAIEIKMIGGVEPYHFQWSSADTTTVIQGIKAGVYTTSIKDRNNCEVKLLTTVTQPEQVQANLRVNPIKCAGANDGTIELSINGGTGNYLYEWSNGNKTKDIDSLGIGEYSVRVTDLNLFECAEAYATITQPDSLSIDSVALVNSCWGSPEGSISLYVSGGTPGYTFNWSNGAVSSSILELYPKDYTVQIKDFMLCRLDTLFNVKEIECKPVLEMPNIFTPNNDGNNDIFTFIRIKYITKYDASIYNRWGQLIYKWNEAQSGWDGKIGNTDASPGVYFYLLNADGNDGNVYHLKGFLHLIK